MRRCLGASFAQLEMRIALRAILSGRGHVGARGREGTGRRSITLSPRRGTPVSVRPRVREPQSPSAPDLSRAYAREKDRASFPEALVPVDAQGPGRGRSRVDSDLPRGRGPAAIMSSCSGGRFCSPVSRSSRAPAAAMRRSGEDAAGAEAVRHRRRPRRSATRPRRRRRRHQGLDRRAAHGHVKAASRYFALPGVVSNGTPPIKLDKREDVRLLQPLAAVRRDVQGGGRHRRVRGRHARLTERPGPGECGTGVGNEAFTAFLIRRHKIVQWRRVIEPAPEDEAPAGPRAD